MHLFLCEFTTHVLLDESRASYSGLLTCISMQNTAISEAGALFVEDGAGINMLGAVQVVSNSARRSGAVSLRDASMVLEGAALFRDNAATGATASGGALDMAGSSVTVVGARFISNTAASGVWAMTDSLCRPRTTGCLPDGLRSATRHFHAKSMLSADVHATSCVSPHSASDK
jgi:hypothetical protein